MVGEVTATGFGGAGNGAGTINRLPLRGLNPRLALRPSNRKPPAIRSSQVWSKKTWRMTRVGTRATKRRRERAKQIPSFRLAQNLVFRTPDPGSEFCRARFR